MRKKVFKITLALSISTLFISPLKAENFQEAAKKQMIEQVEVIKGCEPFEYSGNNGKMVLLLHGLGGCPHEVSLLGEYLNSKGYSVKAIRYPGHGVPGKEMSKFSWNDWYNAAETEYLNLSKTKDQIYIAGFSTGGTIGLRLAENYQVQKLVLLSPFIFLTHKWFYGFTPETYLNSIGKLFDDLPANMTIVNLNDPKARKKYVRGDYFSVKATRSALELIGIVKKDLDKVKSPTLLMHSKGDETTDYKSSEYIFTNIGSVQKKLITLKKSNHLIPLDYEKETVFTEVQKFLDDENGISLSN